MIKPQFEINLETGLEFTEFRLRFRNSEIKGQELTQSLLITVSTQSSQVAFSK